METNVRRPGGMAMTTETRRLGGMSMSARILRLGALLLTSVPLGAPLAAQQWRPVGPPGGIFGPLAAAASRPETIYLLGSPSSDQQGTLYRSDDAGRSWQTVPGPLLFNLLAVDPRHASTLFGVLAGAPHRLAKSLDGGKSWVPADKGLAAVEAQAYPVAPVFDPGKQPRLFLPTAFGLFESDDAGHSWGLRALSDVFILGFSIDPGHPSRWYAMVTLPVSSPCNPDTESCFFADVLESQDHGLTWSSTHLPSAPGAVPTQLLAGAGAQYVLDGTRVLRRSEGRHWVAATPLPLAATRFALAPSGLLHAATSIGVYTSADDGRSWLPPAAAPQPIDTIVSLAVLPDAVETVLASGFEEIWRSDDRGGSWLSSSAGLLGHDIDSLAVAADSKVYVAVPFEGIFRSADGGAAWKKRNGGLGVDLPPFTGDVASFTVLDLSSDPHDPATLYATLERGSLDHIDLARTANAGRSWQVLPRPPAGLGHVVVDPSSSQSLYAIGSVTAPGVLLHSGDGGGTWSQLLADRLGVFVFALDPQRPGTLYAWTFSRGLLKTTDGGASWQEAARQLPELASSDSDTLVVDPQDSQTLYAGTVHGVYVSHDGGASFTAMAQGLPAVTYSRKLLVDPRAPSRLYLLDQAGVFRWLADQQTWVPLDSGLPASVYLGYRFALDPQHPEVLYLGVFDHGLYRLDLGE
jgi:photosystem II stability/assembly factor-like uncharacterized protein